MPESIYLRTALEAANYLEELEIQENGGIYWDISQAFKGEWRYYDSISLYAGSSGIIKFFLDLYESTGDNIYYEKAIKAGFHILNRLNQDDHLDKAFSKYAMTTGLGGLAFILDELYDKSDDSRFFNAVKTILNKIVLDSQETGAWSEQIGIVTDSGTALLLLKLADKYEITQAKSVLVRFGDYILSKRQVDSEGQVYYVGLNLDYVGGPHGKFNTGFPLGPGGVAYTLLKLWEYTGERRFLEGANGIDDFYKHYSIDKEKLLFPHYLPDDDEHICYVGYCGGPVGVARYFYQAYLTTKNKQYLENFKQSVDGLSLVNAPYERSEGYWQVNNYCCGTAGILQLFIGAYLITQEEKYLRLAEDTGNILVERAKKVNGKVFWEQAFERKVPDNITIGIGYYDGEAGIAASLLQLDSLLKGNFQAVRFVDDPFPESLVD